jgi:hypothetical protein
MEVGPPLPDGVSLPELRVDTHSLQAFGTFMRRELDQNIGPMAARVGPTLMNGAMVAGQLPSGDVEAMNAKHSLCVDQMSAQLESFTTKMAIIADAAQTIAARYATSDALSKATLEGITPAFDTATASDTPPPPLPRGRTNE